MNGIYLISVELNAQTIITAAALIAAVIAIYKYITSVHDRAQKWDEQENAIAEVRQSFEESLIEQNAKMQQIQAEQYMQTMVLEAVLDGLHQLKCNGKVTDASNLLHEHMNKQAHGVEL